MHRVCGYVGYWRHVAHVKLEKYIGCGRGVLCMEESLKRISFSIPSANLFLFFISRVHIVKEKLEIRHKAHSDQAALIVNT